MLPEVNDRKFQDIQASFDLFLTAWFGASPILATGSGSNDPELEFKWESELPNL